MRRSLLLALALAAAPVWGADVADPSLSSVQVSRPLPPDPRDPPGTTRSACGSGTVVRSEGGRSWVLTNHHVAGDGPARRFVRVAGLELPARLVRIDDQADLAVLEVDADLVAAELADEEPAVGAVVRQWGFPYHAPGRCEKAGTVLPYDGGREKRGGAPIWRSTIDSRSGDSGAGVFHRGPDGRWRLVAVNWGRPDFDWAREQAACPLANVRRCLEAALGR